MRSKISLKWSLFIVSIAGIIFSTIIILFFTFSLLAQDSYAKSSPPKEQMSLPVGQAGSELPVRLKIPRINVNATVEYVGLTSDGAMDVPKGPSNAAWFDLGPRPGENGSAVIDGHSGWKNGIPAVFDNLYKLQRGDKIYVQNEKGATITFVVREIRSYNPNADAGDVFNSSDGKAHLNLITCGGVWNAIKKTHSERLVVFTDKEVE